MKTLSIGCALVLCGFFNACFPSLDGLVGLPSEDASAASDAHSPVRDAAGSLDSGAPDAATIEIPPPAFHLRADQGTFAGDAGASTDGGIVLQWKDTSTAGPAMNAFTDSYDIWTSAPPTSEVVQVPGASQPRAVLRLHPLYRFVSSAQKDLWTGNSGFASGAPLNIPRPYTFMMVARAEDHANGDVMNSYIAVFSGFALGRKNSGDLTLLTPRSAIETSVKAGNTWVTTLTCRSDATLTMHVDGKLVGSEICDDKARVDGLYLGVPGSSDVRTRSGYGMSGWLGEVWIFAQELSAEQRMSVERQAGAFWGVALSP